MKKLIFLLYCVLSLSFPAISGQINNVIIDTIVVDQYGMARITASGGSEVKSKASCSNSTNNNEYVYDVNSIAGKAWHSMVLSAQATQKKVHLVGKNSCLMLWGTNPYEAINAIYLLR